MISSVCSFNFSRVKCEKKSLRARNSFTDTNISSYNNCTLINQLFTVLLVLLTGQVQVQGQVQVETQQKAQHGLGARDELSFVAS